jgi:hypothetical protein
MQFLRSLRGFFGALIVPTLLGVIGTLFFQLESLFYIVLAAFALSVFAYLGLYILLYFLDRK